MELKKLGTERTYLQEIIDNCRDDPHYKHGFTENHHLLYVIYLAVRGGQDINFPTVEDIQLLEEIGGKYGDS